MSKQNRYARRVTSNATSGRAIVPFTLTPTDGSELRFTVAIDRPREWPAHARWDKTRVQRAARRGIAMHCRSFGPAKTVKAPQVAIDPDQIDWEGPVDPMFDPAYARMPAPTSSVMYDAIEGIHAKTTADPLTFQLTGYAHYD